MNPAYGNRFTSVKELTVEHKAKIPTARLGKLRLKIFGAWYAIPRCTSDPVVSLALDPLEDLVDLRR